MTRCHNTFASLETPPGRGGIGVICLTGPNGQSIIERIFKPADNPESMESNALRLGHICWQEQIIDQAIVTRQEDVYEINVHSGIAVTRKILGVLAELGATILPNRKSSGIFKSAHPRWNNPAIGKEMLEAILDARTELAVAAISSQWSNGLSKLATGHPEPSKLARATDHLARMRRLLEPAEVVLAGGPNVGKSQLANALMGRKVSIVHDMAGTTRDWVREMAIINGVPIWLTDTAGLWQSNHQIDVEAVQRARTCIRQADLVLLIEAGTMPTAPSWLAAKKLLPVVSKCDLTKSPKDALAISALTGHGMDTLKREILACLHMDKFKPSEPMAFTHRQARLLKATSQAILNNDDLIAEAKLRELLSGQRSLGNIVRNKT